MEQKLIFWPVVLQMLLTAYLYLRIVKVKNRARAAGEVDLKAAALDSDAWPDYVRKFSNNLRNQFELPVMFYALVIALFALGAADIYAIAFASLFALSRLVHSYFHTGANHVPNRLKAFKVGAVGVVGLLALLIRALIY